MRETLLNHLFKIIASLRRVEINLINQHQREKAEKVRAANRTFSSFRDKLITAQLTEATVKLASATDLLQTTSDQLYSYLNAKEAANRKLEAVLSNLPVALALLNTLTD
ncbi:MAG: hypothetical protein U9P42_01535 [Candidatus Fermentibacteria bacterium]|nr:hypothetical protein [Candidatus Fermentibacteria bacterium]